MVGEGGENNSKMVTMVYMEESMGSFDEQSGAVFKGQKNTKLDILGTWL